MKWRVEDKWVPIEIEREAIGAKLSFQGEVLRIEEEEDEEEEAGFWVSDSVVLFLSCYNVIPSCMEWDTVEGVEMGVEAVIYNQTLLIVHSELTI